MHVEEVMSTGVITVSVDDPLKAAAHRMVEAGVGGLPVLDAEGALVGIITEADFLKREAAAAGRFRLLGALLRRDEVPEADTVGQAMTRDPKTVLPEMELGQAARLMVKHSVKRLPVVDTGGSLVGIVSRADVLEAFSRSDERIAREIREEVMHRILFLDRDAIDVAVDDGVVTLKGRTETRTEYRTLIELSKRVDGVIRVIDEELSFDVDDRIGPDPQAPRL